MASLDKYMAQYDHEHTNALNKVLHGIGIPMILAGIVLANSDFLADRAGAFCRRLGCALPGSSNRGQQTGVFPGRDLFPCRAGLGCQGN